MARKIKARKLSKTATARKVRRITRNIYRASGVGSLAYAERMHHVLPHSHVIVGQLVHEMGADNGCTFHPTEAQLRDLLSAVRRMREAGCWFTAADVELLTAGEVSERDRALSAYDGYTDANRTLAAIFNGRMS